jgi:hypothetical protein
VAIYDQRSGGAPVQTKMTNVNGKQKISVLIRDEVTKQIAGGSFDTVMGATYGSARSGTPRYGSRS